jgi:uncharacterized protein YbbK (DUF523 family)
MARPILVSACLLGLNTRYDGARKTHPAVLKWLAEQDWIPIPICPEQLAGLPTPRTRTFFARGDGADVLEGLGEVVDEDGLNRNATFLRGAQESLKIARLTGCRLALFKERSPSCGVHQVYRGPTKIDGLGVTSALLKQHGLTLYSEEDIGKRAFHPDPSRD